MIARGVAAVPLICTEGVARNDEESELPCVTQAMAQNMGWAAVVDESRRGRSGISLLSHILPTGSALHEAPFPPDEAAFESAGDLGHGAVIMIPEENRPEALLEVMEETPITADVAVPRERPIPRGAHKETRGQYPCSQKAGD